MTMKITSLLLFPLFLFSVPFTDNATSMTLDVPEEFVLTEESSYNGENSWWYTFSDSEENMITIEIEAYDEPTTLPEHFHKSMTETDRSGNERIIYQGLEFKNFTLSDIEFTKLKIRFLMISEQFAQPLTICDYLFVRDHYGITISLLKKETSPQSNQEIEELMHNMLSTINFSLEK